MVSRIHSATDDQGMHLLLESLDRPHNSYLIGAGVSYPSVPIGSSITDAVECKWLSMPGFHVVTPQRGPLFRRLGIAALDKAGELRRGLLALLSDASIKNILVQIFARPYELSLPVSYRVFRRLPRPMTIYNMNVDGLASKLISNGLAVFSMHGTVPTNINWASSENVDLADELIELGMELPQADRFWCPQPEPIGITCTRPYRAAEQLLSRATALIVIGYSFGSNGSSVDDHETLAFFSQFAQSHSIPITVLDVSPGMVVDLLAAETGAAHVVGITVDWGALARSVLAVCASWCCLPRLASEGEEILSRYRSTLETQPP